MALLFMEGFDAFSTTAVTAVSEMTASTKFQNAVSNITGQSDTPYADAIGQSMRCNSHAHDYWRTKNLTMSGNRAIVSFWIKRTNNDSYGGYRGYFLLLENGAGADHIFFGVDPTATNIWLCKGGVPNQSVFTEAQKLDDQMISLPLNIWTHFCLDVELATDATGSVKLYQDGVLIVNNSDIITTDVAVDGSIAVRSGWSDHASNDHGYLYDDLIVMDGSGTKHNEFLGIQRIVPLLATSDYEVGAGMVAKSAGTCFSEVDESALDASTDSYVTSSTIGERNLYGIEDLATVWPDVGEVDAVEIVQYAGVDLDAGADVRNVINDGTNTIESADLNITTVAPKQRTSIFPDAPDSGDWTLAKAQALKIGHKYQA